MASLQDQLMKSGLVDQKKAKKLKQEKRKQQKQQGKGQPVIDEAKQAAKRAMAEKAARDSEINRKNHAIAEQKAIQAQIIQLIELNRIERSKGDISYQFVDGKKIKKLYVSDKLQDQLGKGQIAIAKVKDRYELVPAAVADKIKQRDETAVVLHNTNTADQTVEDDPYADYQIPDDLMW